MCISPLEIDAKSEPASRVTRVSVPSPEMALTALATDGTFNDTTSVKVTVLAANHDKPRFVRPSADNKIFYVTEVCASTAASQALFACVNITESLEGDTFDKRNTWKF